MIAKLRPELLESADGGESRAGRTENLAAHNLYLQGRYHLNQRTEEGLQKAVDFFEGRSSRTPQYALAHSGPGRRLRPARPLQVLGPARGVGPSLPRCGATAGDAGRPVRGGPHLARPRESRRRTGTGPGAEREFQRAISLDPHYPTAHHWYAMSCLAPHAAGSTRRAIEMQLAQSLDPVSAIIARDLAMVHYYRRDFEAALDQCDHTIELNPHFAPAYWTLGLIQEQRKDFDESAAAFQRAGPSLAARSRACTARSGAPSPSPASARWPSAS